MKNTAASIAAAVLFAAAGSSAFAQCATDDRGRARYSVQLTRLDEDQLRRQVKTLAARDGKTRARLELRCHLFKGADLVKILNEAPADAPGDYWSVRINRSIIEDGLPLRSLSRLAVAAFPQQPYGAALAWARSGRSARWRNGNREVPVFRGAMVIGNSIIRGGRENPVTGERTGLDARGAYFLGRVNMVNVQFAGSANFTDAVFGDSLGVRRADFRGRARFGGAAWLKRARFDAVRFRDEVDFAAARALGLFRFYRTTVDGALSFRRALLCDRLSMVRMRANAPADFSGSIFFRRLTLSRVRFAKSVQFRRARLPDGIRVDGGRLGTYADFSAARIGDFDMRHRGSRAVVTARLDFRRARIDRVRIGNASFAEEADFSDAVIGEAPGEVTADPRRGRSSLCPAGKSATAAGGRNKRDPGAARYGLSLVNVTFEDDAGFLRARLPLSAEFRRVRFRGPADFTDARFVRAGRAGRRQEFRFSYVDLGADTRIRWTQLPALEYWKQHGRLQPLSSVLAGLERYFRGRGLPADANAAYRQFEAMQRAELGAAASAALGAKGTPLWRALLTPELPDFVTLPVVRDALAAEAKWLFWGLPAGYGTRIWRLLMVALAIQLIFTLIYYRLATVARRPAGRAHAGSWLRLFDPPGRYLGEFSDEAAAPVARRRLRDAFAASLLLMFKLGRAEVRIDGGGLVRLLVRLQWLIGYLAVAAIVYTLGRTQPAVGALIGYLF